MLWARTAALRILLVCAQEPSEPRGSLGTALWSPDTVSPASHPLPRETSNKIRYFAPHRNEGKDEKTEHKEDIDRETGGFDVLRKCVLKYEGTLL